jgi:CheY-like chemotaxis protein
MSGRKILIVDDDPIVHLLYRRNLEKEGFELLGARNGREAVTLAEEAVPDLIVMDIMMPEQDGIATLRRLKESDTTRNVPVLVITASSSVYTTIGQEARIGGAAGLLTKPLSPARLVSEVRRLIPAGQP